MYEQDFVTSQSQSWSIMQLAQVFSYGLKTCLDGILKVLIMSRLTRMLIMDDAKHCIITTFIKFLISTISAVTTVWLRMGNIVAFGK